MPQNSTLTQELSLATLIFENSVLVLVRIKLILPKIREKTSVRQYHILVAFVPDHSFGSYNLCDCSRQEGF